MASFDKAIEKVLRFEGGLVDSENDPGGVTNYGISLRWAVSQMKAAGDEMRDLLDVDDDGDIDADDIRALTPEVARPIYRLGFWDRYRYSQIISQEIADKVMDMTVNMGPRQSHRNAQRAIRACGARIVDDGIIGPATRSALNSVNEHSVVAAMRSEQAGFYRMLIARNGALRKEGIHVPDFSVFRDGWLRRAYA